MAHIMIKAMCMWELNNNHVTTVTGIIDCNIRDINSRQKIFNVLTKTFYKYLYYTTNLKQNALSQQ